MLFNRFSVFNVKADKGKTPLIAIRCADNRQLFEGTVGKEKTMTISKIFTELGLIKDDTEIWVRDADLHILAHGNWFQDDVLKYTNCEVESFTWQDDNNFYIDVKQGVE
jgi:hypothetical protein